MQAERGFQRAIQLDSTFAQAYAELAWCYATPDRLALPYTEAKAKGRGAVARALAVNSDIVSAHAALAMIMHRMEYHWIDGERAARKAVDLDPSDADARNVLGQFLFLRGNVVGGLDQIRRASQLQPFNLDLSLALGFALFSVHLYDEAIAQFGRTLELDSNWTTAKLWLAESLAARGSLDQAVGEYLDFLHQALVPAREAKAATNLRDVYSTQGWRAFWAEELKLCEEEHLRPGTVWRSPFGRYCGHRFTWPAATRVLVRRILRIVSTGLAIVQFAMVHDYGQLA